MYGLSEQKSTALLETAILLLAPALLFIVVSESTMRVIAGSIPFPWIMVAIAILIASWFWAAIRVSKRIFKTSISRPTQAWKIGIGGRKPGSVPVSLGLAVIVLAILTTSCAFVFGARSIWYIAALAIQGMFLGYLLYSVIRRMRQLTLVRERNVQRVEDIVNEISSLDNVPRNAVIAVLQVIAAVVGVEPGHLRAKDEFGKEVGLLSPFDETLEILSTRLCDHRQYPTRVSLEHIRSVRDYVAAWCRSS